MMPKHSCSSNFQLGRQLATGYTMSQLSSAISGVLLLIFISIGATSSQQIALETVNENKLEKSNASVVEIHFVLDLLDWLNKEPRQQQLQRVIQNSSVNDLEKMFTQVLDGNWSKSFLLLELAELTQDLDVKTTIFEILYNALQPSKKIYDPFELIQFYETFEDFLPLHKIKCTPEQSTRIASLRQRLRHAVTSRSAQILEASAHLPNNIYFSSTPQRLLHRFEKLEDQLFVETMDQVYDAVEALVHMEQLVQVMSNFSINTKQSVIANLRLLVRLSNISKEYDVLVDNLKALLYNEDFGKVEPHWRALVNSFLPQSLRNLHAASKVCIRNATNAARYLYECPQTYLMCTNDNQLLPATFHVDRNEDGEFAFRSLYWTNRYIHLEGNATISGNMTSSLAFIKNVYSKLGPDYWKIVHNGDKVALFDPTLKLCLCGGNSLAWNSEQHVYTRRAEDFTEFRQECEWFIEDCSGV